VIRPLPRGGTGSDRPPGGRICCVSEPPGRVPGRNAEGPAKGRPGLRTL